MFENTNQPIVSNWHRISQPSTVPEKSPDGNMTNELPTKVAKLVEIHPITIIYDTCGKSPFLIGKSTINGNS